MKERNSGGRFQKEIGLFGGVSLVAGMTIGSGIYYLGSLVLERANMSMGMALLCWIVGGGVSILGGLCFAELGAAMPVAGGMTTYLSRAYHPAVGFINGFGSFILTGSGSIAALALACVTAFQGTFSLSEGGVKRIAVGIILLFTLINLRGVRGASRLQNFTMVARVVPLILIILLGLCMGRQSPELSLGRAVAGLNAGGVIKLIAFSTFASLWAYEGWTNLNTVAEEMKNPKRHLPRAIIYSVGGITLLYTLFNLAIYRMIPSGEVQSMIGSGELYLGNEVASRILGGFGKWLVLAGMTIGILGTVNGDVLVFPRTYYAMAKGGYFPKSFASLSRNGVPVAATWVSTLLAILLVLFNSLRSLTDMLVFTSALLNLLAIASVLIFRVKHPEMERPYRVWGGVPTILITMLLFTVLLINEFVSNPKNALIGMGILLLGLPVYRYFRRRNGGVEYDGDAM